LCRPPVLRRWENQPMLSIFIYIQAKVHFRPQFHYYMHYYFVSWSF